MLHLIIHGQVYVAQGVRLCRPGLCLRHTPGAAALLAALNTRRHTHERCISLSPAPPNHDVCDVKKRLLHTRHRTPATSLVTNEAPYRLRFARNVMYRVNKRQLKLEQRLNNG